MSKRLDRRVLIMWWTGGAAVVVAASIAWFWAAALAHVPVWIPFILTGAAALLAGLLPPLRYRRWAYQLRERDVLISKGALFYVRQLIPFDRIQFVESRQGPLDRLFGLSQVVLYTAAGRAGRVPGLSGRQAEVLREELSRVAGATSV
jgi:membrane protein YdbS with pleckstrin-like domain